MKVIIDTLFERQDMEYADFHRKLIPNIPPQRVIGVRTPILRQLAKQLAKDPMVEAFLSELPHYYYEENQLHAFILAEIKDFSQCIEQTCLFLPYIDNWATCDQFSPCIFARYKTELLSYIRCWMNDKHPYTVRFGIGMLMRHFLKDDYDDAYPAMVASVASEHYYIRMMQAWYFATALTYHWDSVLPLLSCLDEWTRRKAIQKACESYRITTEQKDFLKSLSKKGQ